jgi:excinuclease ABC subunit C
MKKTLKGLLAIRKFQETAPETPGIYRMLDADGRVLYIGKAKNLKKRIRNYTELARLSDRIRNMVVETRSVEVIRTNTENEALILEQNLIKQQDPKFNILLKDDKSYPYLTISKEEFPKVAKFRGDKNSASHFFGPFPSATSVTESLKIMQSVFGLRTCSASYFKNRRNPCLLYQIKKCSGPCCGKISREEYARSAESAIAFLKGRSRTLIDELSKKMQEASAVKDYEAAMSCRDKIGYLNQMLKKSTLASVDADADVVALVGIDGAYRIEVLFSRASVTEGNLSYSPAGAKGASDAEILSAFLEHFYVDREIPKQIITNVELGEARDELAETLSGLKGAKVEIAVPRRGGRKLLLETVVKNGRAKLEQSLIESLNARKYMDGLQKLFGLPGPPERIDVFDNSHIFGTSKIGAMIVAGPSGFRKTDYRKYNISSAVKGDDYRMMQEVLSRRYARAKAENTLPGLIILDGGKPQLDAAAQVLGRLGLNIPLVGIAKTEGHDAGGETLVMNGR